MDVRSRSFPASAHFFDQDFTSQFGEGDEDGWVDEDDEEYDTFGPEPNCPTQLLLSFTTKFLEFPNFSLPDTTHEYHRTSAFIPYYFDIQ